MGSSPSKRSPFDTGATHPLYDKITWTSFLGMIKELNNVCSHVRNERDDYICFALDRTCSDGFMWKKLAKIKCFTVNKDSLQVTSSKVLRLNEFLNVYSVHKDAVRNNSSNDMSTSQYIFNETADSDGLCCICMENNNEVLLPCLHAFCMVCVALEMEFRPQFSCPICKARIEHPIEESWEVPDPPNPEEVVAYLSKIGGK
ncbi:zinc finger, C3HC4 type [Oesophagostomum dentatum]|uniref:Zinc finger, C3HC4 type n=1 Tax=Oesophagostomum dentatum TaxID=61180 RepID=A0A0B1T9L8_OESDE|nr:zinc finger, C3HC4 type [Oesophagostomum dentatum]